MMYVLKALLPVGLMAVFSQGAVAAVPEVTAETVREFTTFDARQGIAVDAEHFYAVNNFRISKHRKDTGAALLQWDGVSDESGPLVHLDSGMVWEGRLYAAHSNYPIWPMASSVEVWDTETLEHVASHSFGIGLGSLTWLDRYRGYWWATFGNYDKVQKGQPTPYGYTHNTQVVKMDDQFQILQKWTMPVEVLERMRPMTNSGGSWGADGLLYLTGHDLPEIYVMRLPRFGATLEWVATVRAEDINGQGIAWDRSTAARELWAIRKRDRRAFKILLPEIPVADAAEAATNIRSPHQFNTR